MSETPQSWIEVIDPQTGRKVDILVSFHSDWGTAGEPREVTADHINRIANVVVDRLSAERIETISHFELSDHEGAE